MSDAGLPPGPDVGGAGRGPQASSSAIAAADPVAVRAPPPTLSPGEIDVGALATVQVSVDDHRALWAMTNRHLRGPAFPAVLLVRQALRRGANRIAVSTRGGRLIVVDDGGDLRRELRHVEAVIRHPTVQALHAVEAAFGTEILVTTSLATTALVQTQDEELRFVGGAPGRIRHREGTPRGRGLSPPGGMTSWPNVVVLERPASLGPQEREELRAWVTAPRAHITVDGRRQGQPWRLQRRAFWPRAFEGDSASATVGGLGRGRGQVGVLPGASVSQLTVTARGVWVAQEQFHPRHLPVVAHWDADSLPADPTTLLPAARAILDRATDELVDELAARFSRLARSRQVQLRRLLVRAGPLPPAFDDVALFDDEQGPFRQSLASLRRQLQARSHFVVGRTRGDLIVDDDTRAFLATALPGAIVEGLPPPPERWQFRLRRWLRRVQGR